MKPEDCGSEEHYIGAWPFIWPGFLPKATVPSAAGGPQNKSKPDSVPHPTRFPPDALILHILMTALVTGLGLLPLAIGSGDPGRITVAIGPSISRLGGLVTSTLLNLLVLPTLALRYGKFEPPMQS